MSKEIYISSTPHETRLAIVENDALTEIYYERENEYTLAGSIYNGKVTRVLPGMQSSFVDIGLERDAFLYITDFMEEAGDSADFEITGNGSSSRSGNRDRGDRDGNRDFVAPATIEGSTQPTSDDSAPRSDRGDRSGRSDRGGRGRRDRGRSGNRERQPRSDPSDRSDGTQPAASIGSGYEAPNAEFAGFNDQPILDEDLLSADRPESSELGEAAPGADGSRRWRGRRGRRRGRGPGSSEESQATGDQTQPFNEVSPETDSRGDGDFTLEFGAAAAEPTPEAGPRNTAPVASAYGQPDNQPTDRNDRDRGRGRGRGDRGGRNRGDRGPRNDSRSPRTDDRGPRVPRGFAPKTDLYGVDSTPAYAAPAYGEAPEALVGEPIILPGESLSKYRRDEEVAAPKASIAETIVLPSAPSYTLSSDWDGGSVLPGETLSRRRSEPSRPEPIRSESSRSESRRPEPQASHRTEDRTEFRVLTPPAEYEPTEASASYRVDPVSQSEFRQSAPVLEPEGVVERPVVKPVVEQVAEPAEPITQHHAATPETNVWDWQKPAATPEAAVPAHDITTLHSTGELISTATAIEPPTPPAAHHEVADPTTPIHHETAVLSPETLESTVGVVHEEELVGEEEVQTLHASAIEEMDDFDEQETLEGAADLGTMIREMSIDQITRPAAADSELEVDEEDFEDFEEEDTIEDQVGEEEDSGSEDVDSGEEGSDSVTHEPAAEHIASNGFDHNATSAVPAREGDRDRDRGRHRRDGRRDSRRDGRGDGRGGRDRDRSRNTGGAGDRERSGRSRQSMQSTNLPAISDLLKPGQEVLVQIAKEPIAKKGARITSHIALPGRFLVFMPTVNHTGVSRKIESDGERRRLKEILLSEKGDASGGFIVRTAAAGATEEELRSDLRFLLNLWTDIKTRSESSKSPALIYHDLNLVERILRDQVTDNFSAIWVDTETDYERILRFLQRFQPALIRRVKLYTKETPLFEQFGITEEINKALRSKVWLKSGGSIVINQTEALVAIDINTGKFVGKTARLEDTIVKTNLDAIPEIVRQIRLRDLGGIIIIDFIDMDERKNRNRVMAALEDELKSDRAPSKVLQFNDFGLVAITRKRVKQSLERTLSTTCNVCVGTGMVKSPITVCNDIYIEMRKMHKHLDRGDVMLRVHPEVVKALKSSTSRWLQEMEEMVGKTILVKSDPTLHPEQFDIH